MNLKFNLMENPGKLSDYFIKAFQVAILGMVMIVFSPIQASAQNCDCDFTVPASQQEVDGAKMNIRPGQTICLASGERKFMRIINIKGSPGNPITIKNCGGQTVIRDFNSGYLVRIDASSHFKFVGDGDPNHEYGIHLAGAKSGVSALNIGDLSTDFEVHHIEMSQVGFAGIMAKTDPRCDGSANRGNFVMRNVKLHHNYIHDIGGEGLYVGNSFFANGHSRTCNGQEVRLMPHDIVGLRIHDNIIKNVGWDGIQVGCAVSDTRIYGNIIENYGTAAVRYQDTGIQINPGTTGHLYNNLIKDGRGNGPAIMMLGIGENYTYNNVIVNTVDNGIFCDDRRTYEGHSFHFMNNTFVNVRGHGILMYSRETKGNTFYNNIIAGYQGEAIRTLNGVDLRQEGNFIASNIADVKFVNASGNDFNLQDDSPAIGRGVDLSHLFDFDYANRMRPNKGSFDAGAFTTVIAEEPEPPIEESSKMVLFTNILNVSKEGGADGAAVATITGGTEPYTFQWSNGKTTAQNSNLKAGYYKVTVRDAQGNVKTQTVVIREPLSSNE